MLRKILVILCLLFLAACNATSPEAKPSVEYQLGDIVYQNDFETDTGDWEAFGYAQIQFGISNGTYNAISSGGGYITVSNQDVESNVVIVVQVQQVSSDNNVSFGIVCRSQLADPNVGYYFMISGDGQYGIRLGDGRRVRPLVPWTTDSSIKQGQGAINNLRVVCIDDYLAFYINDKFVAETHYDWLKEGRTGFVVDAAKNVGVAVQYDNLKIWDASLPEKQAE